ncbi:protein of unknown function [Methylacidimicrobium sp. AP8]|uniref:hypothetical protein n=1 Tax=Methylacidimicrobium sp. AP8 TaxID=2730359 RepID=UPI0018C09921|nr:hypothetical protein [Methylacidimicrobium sp. AP8]CAB4244080.1 protein of unknown function [Methylacidimicrobium sp. AP8]
MRSFLDYCGIRGQKGASSFAGGRRRLSLGGDAMIVKVALENWKSFRDPVEFSMVASR